MKLPEKTRSPGSKTCISATFSSINLTFSGQVINRRKISDSHYESENVSFIIIIIYKYFPKKEPLVQRAT